MQGPEGESFQRPVPPPKDEPIDPMASEPGWWNVPFMSDVKDAKEQRGPQTDGQRQPVHKHVGIFFCLQFIDFV